MLILIAAFLLFVLIAGSAIELVREGHLQYDLNLKTTFPIFFVCVILFDALMTFTYVPFVGKPAQVVFLAESANNASEIVEQLKKHIIKFSNGKRIARTINDSEVLFVRDNKYLDWVTGNFSIFTNINNEIIVRANQMYIKDIKDIKAKFRNKCKLSDIS
jgi:hypothetical protein